MKNGSRNISINKVKYGTTPQWTAEGEIQALDPLRDKTEIRQFQTRKEPVLVGVGCRNSTHTKYYDCLIIEVIQSPVADSASNLRNHTVDSPYESLSRSELYDVEILSLENDRKALREANGSKSTDEVGALEGGAFEGGGAWILFVATNEEKI
uniref:Uncharacterized protein n=1 Tax=Syphacia muris TaxID=451379 RepID=A0A158R663_9BILA